MSGNPYRRSGGPPSQNGQGSGNGYYRVNNSQYHHSNHGNNHNYKHNNTSHGYNRSRYNQGYNNQYDSRHAPYHSPHHNPRYHHPSSYNSNNINGSISNSSNNSPRHSFTSPNAAYQSGADSSYSSSPKVNHQSPQGEKPVAQLTSKSGGPPVNNAQLFSSRRGNESYSNLSNATNTSVTVATPSHSPFASKDTAHDTKIEQSVKVESFEESLKKKPLDIKSLQPMKKKKPNVQKEESSQSSSTDEVVGNSPRDKSTEHHHNPETIQVKKEEVKEEEESAVVDDIHNKSTIYELDDTTGVRDNNNVSRDIIDEGASNETTDMLPSDVKIKEEAEMKRRDSSEVKEEQNTEMPKKEESVEKSATKSANSDDEDEPIHSKARHVSADVSQGEESEEDTDIEDSIPVPSRKTRRLHRLLQSSASDDSHKHDSANTSIKPLVSKKRNANSSNSASNSASTSHSSRSQSPKQRKTSRTGRDASGRTLLQRMCAKGNTDEVKRLIKDGQDINDADFAGITPLHEAALEGHYDITVLLLDNNANINVQSGQMDKDTPLIDAVSNLHYKVVQLLLKRGADPTIQNAQGQNAVDVLESTIKEYEEDNEQVPADAKKIRKLLTQFSQNFASTGSSRSNRKGRDRPSSNATDDESHFSGDNQHSYPSLRNGGANSLQERISANDVTFVLNYVSSMNGKKIPPEALLLASKLGFPDIASLLIAFGADINFRDKNGWTPLMHAVGKGHLEMVKLLLSNQVDVLAKDKKNRTALDILKQNGLTGTEEFTLLFAKIKESQSLEEDSDVKMDLDESDAVPQEEEEEAEEESKEEEEEEEEEDVSSDNQADHSFVDDGETRSDSRKRKPPTREKNDVKRELENGNGDQRLSKKQKLSDEKVAMPEDTVASVSPSPSPSVKRASSKPKRKHEEEPVEEKKVTPVPPTAEEIEAQRLKEIEAQKAREALEHQRLERKKLKQQEIAKRIDAFEKQREEEKKALERLTLEKKRKEEEEQSKLLKKQEESRKKEEIKYAIEKRKLIRSFYPYGLKEATFQGVPDKSEIEKFLPLYVFKIGDTDYLIDLQLNLLLGAENLYSKYPQLGKKKVKLEEKQGVWNVLWPLIGSFKNGYKSVDELQKVYESEGNNFKELVINWIRLDNFEDLMKQEELKDVCESVERIGICRAALTIEKPPIAVDGNTTAAKEVNVKSGSTIVDLEAATDKESTNFPRRFGKRARTALRMMNKPLW